MKIAIVGSRRYTNRAKVEKVVDELPQNTIIVSGGCRGVDTWAVERAKKRNLKTIVFLPKIPKKGTRWEIVEAYYKRNARVCRESDKIIAFVAEDRRGGTENTLRTAKKLNKKIDIEI